ncbi:putative cytokinetic ring protein SteA [Corynebacterium crudilactis]|uniref:Thiamine pyrophosphokinase n=1 Tax=Corynebacterium crudilactis TaxID=1652495 RepID=A0A172QTB1_9CORY|nr:putative cytokinetic ring protein SteA [Corynebacterium crudilactis]ANE03945.1 thiamine pyrophosphokinase [Corynebacterium crudilactis]
MGCMSLFNRKADLPGLHGATRICTAQGKGLKRLSEGDLAIIDAPDLSRTFAQRLLAAKPAAVLNVSRFTTGSVPNFGPQLLIDADIMLVEGFGHELLDNTKDSKKGRLTEDGQLFYGERLIANGTVFSGAAAEHAFADAQQSLLDRMEAYFGNTIQFIHSEAPLLIDGLGIPETGKSIEGRKVLVVSPGDNHRTRIKELRNFIREYDPVLIGVDGAADTLVELGYKPALIVGNPTGIGADALRSGASVILPADPDGHAVGLERIQDLGIGAMTFPSSVNSATDLALLLVDYHNPQMIVNVGGPVTLDGIFENREDSDPAALLTRAKVGTKLVDGSVIAALYNMRNTSSLGWLWALLAVLVVLAVIIVIAGTAGAGSFTDNLIDTWNSFALTVQGWFK